MWPARAPAPGAPQEAVPLAAPPPRRSRLRVLTLMATSALFVAAFANVSVGVRSPTSLSLRFPVQDELRYRLTARGFTEDRAGLEPRVNADDFFRVTYVYRVVEEEHGVADLEVRAEAAQRTNSEPNDISTRIRMMVRSDGEVSNPRPAPLFDLGWNGPLILEEILQEVFPPLPAEQVEPGDQWRRTHARASEGVTEQLEMTTSGELLSVRRGLYGRRASIRVRRVIQPTEFLIRPAEPRRVGRLRVDEQRGAVRFLATLISTVDVDTGELVKSEGDVEYNLRRWSVNEEGKEDRRHAVGVTLRWRVKIERA